MFYRGPTALFNRLTHPPEKPYPIQWSHIQGAGLDGKVKTLAALRHHSVLLFFTCGCAKCRHVGKILNGPARSLFQGHPVVSIAGLPLAAAQLFAREGVFTSSILIDSDHQITDQFHVQRCPFALAVNSAGEIVGQSSFQQPVEREVWRLAAMMKP